jgi:hypothetical protein
MRERMPWPLALGTLIAGVWLSAGGFLFAFTTAGAVMVFLGLGLFLAGLLGLVRLPLWFAAGAGALVTVASIVQLALNGP